MRQIVLPITDETICHRREMEMKQYSNISCFRNKGWETLEPSTSGISPPHATKKSRTLSSSVASSSSFNSGVPPAKNTHKCNLSKPPQHFMCLSVLIHNVSNHECLNFKVSCGTLLLVENISKYYIAPCILYFLSRGFHKLPTMHSNTCCKSMSGDELAIRKFQYGHF